MNAIGWSAEQESKTKVGEMKDISTESRPDNRALSPVPSLARHPGVERQDAKTLVLNRRRTSRVAIRLPVVISSTNDHGVSETFAAFSVVVNKQGARFTGKHLHDLGAIVQVTAVATGKQSNARVVWSRKNDSEFAAEWLEPGNFFNLNFPPEDWADAAHPEARARREESELPKVAAGPNFQQEIDRVLGASLVAREQVSVAASLPESGARVEWQSKDAESRTSMPAKSAKENGLIQMLETVETRSKRFQREADAILADLKAFRDETYRQIAVLPEQVQDRFERSVQESLARVMESLGQQLSHHNDELIETFAARTQKIVADAMARIEASRAKALSESSISGADDVASAAVAVRERFAGSFEEDLRGRRDATLARFEDELNRGTAEAAQRFSECSRSIAEAAAADIDAGAARAVENLNLVSDELRETNVSFVKNSLKQALVVEMKERQQDSLNELRLEIKAACDAGLDEFRAGVAYQIQKFVDALASNLGDAVQNRGGRNIGV